MPGWRQELGSESKSPLRISLAQRTPNVGLTSANPRTWLLEPICSRLLTGSIIGSVSVDTSAYKYLVYGQRNPRRDRATRRHSVFLALVLPSRNVGTAVLVQEQLHSLKTAVRSEVSVKQWSITCDTRILRSTTRVKLLLTCISNEIHALCSGDLPPV